MRTILIDCSPKKKLSASGFLTDALGLMIRRPRVKGRLRSKADHEKILKVLKDRDQLVFIMPLYVDSVPSHVLSFLQELEAYCRETGFEGKVYVAANNGFIEGSQNEPLMQVMENFCDRAGLGFGGGLGIGGGVMLNVMRILLSVFAALMAVNVIGGWAGTGVFHAEAITNFLIQVLVLALLSGGVLFYLIRLALCINRGGKYGKHYTRILLPAVVFIPITDLFFTVMSLAEGGIFRGWFEAKKPMGKRRKK